MSGMNKEGLVIDQIEPVYSKAIEGSLSMKALNNDYLLKEQVWHMLKSMGKEADGFERARERISL